MAAVSRRGERRKKNVRGGARSHGGFSLFFSPFRSGACGVNNSGWVGSRRVRPPTPKFGRPAALAWTALSRWWATSARSVAASRSVTCRAVPGRWRARALLASGPIISSAKFLNDRAHHHHHHHLKLLLCFASLTASSFFSKKAVSFRSSLL